MDAHDLVTGVRWDILQRIAKTPATGAELAAALGTTPANVSQHLKLLELVGLVTKERVNGKSMHYKVEHPTVLLTMLSDDPKRMVVVLDPLMQLELKLLCEKTKKSQYLRRFIAQHEELVRTFTAFGLVRDTEDIQLFVIADDVKHLRKEYANLPVGDKKVVIWSHTPHEVQEGLQRREDYFVNMMRHLAVLYDPHHLLTTLHEVAK
jgi:DNA-binding transcriptional ArsR family regulator